ncbi:MAG TPA: hypothetical protein VGK43_04425 [Solirubrobacterales bacterium]
MPPTKDHMNRRHHIMRGLRQAVEDGLIRNFHVRDLAFAHCYEAKVGPPVTFYFGANTDAMLAVLVRTFGGKVENSSGHAALALNRAMRNPMTRTAFNRQALVPAEERGLIRRTMHVGGKRTDVIQITTKGLKHIGPPPHDPIEFWLPGYEPGGRYNKRRLPKARSGNINVAPDAPDDVVVEQVQEVTPPPPAPPVQFPADVPTIPTIDVLSLQRLVLSLDARLRQAESNNDVLVTRLVEANDEITRLRGLVPEAVLVHTSPPTLGERLTEAEAARLAELAATLAE